MWDDPVVKRTRTLRKEYAAKFNHDLDAIFEDIRHRQDVSKRKRVSRAARRPESRKHVA